MSLETSSASISLSDDQPSLSEILQLIFKVKFLFQVLLVKLFIYTFGRDIMLQHEGLAFNTRVNCLLILDKKLCQFFDTPKGVGRWGLREAEAPPIFFSASS